MGMPKLVQSLLILTPKERKQLLSFVDLPPYELGARTLKYKVLKALVKETDEELMRSDSADIKDLYKLKNNKKEVSTSKINRYNNELCEMTQAFQYFLLVTQESDFSSRAFPGIKEVMLFRFYNERIDALEKSLGLQMRSQFTKVLNVFLQNLEKNQAEYQQHQVYLFSAFLMADYQVVYIKQHNAPERAMLNQQMEDNLEQLYELEKYKVSLSRLQYLRDDLTEAAKQTYREILSQTCTHPPSEKSPAYPYYLSILLFQEMSAARIKKILHRAKHSDAMQKANSAAVDDTWRSLFNISRRYYAKEKSPESEQLFLEVLEQAEQRKNLEKDLNNYKNALFVIVLLCQSADKKLSKRAKHYAQKYTFDNSAAAQASKMCIKALLLFNEKSFKEVLDIIHTMPSTPGFSFAATRNVLHAMALYELAEWDKPDIGIFDSITERTRIHLEYHLDKPNSMREDQARRVQLSMRMLKKLYNLRIDGTLSSEERQAKAEAIKQRILENSRLTYRNWLLNKVDELLD